MKQKIEWMLAGEWGEFATVFCTTEEAQRIIDGQIAVTKPGETLNDPARWRIVSLPATEKELIENGAKGFPATFGMRGFPGGVFKISVRDSYVSEGRVMLYTARLQADGSWWSFAKGTEAEIRREMVPLQGGVKRA